MTEPSDAAPVKVGDVLAEKYEVEQVLGIGGMGAVVAARHLELDELRALKFMLPKVSADQEAAKRFLREARAVARLRSEHVATIHDVGRLEGGEPYLVMEYLDGEDLRTLLKRRSRLELEEAVDLTMQALAGLAEAHAIGIVHRDLKPPNVFVSEGIDGLPRAKILDFGVSKLLGAGDVPELDMTKTNAMLGSPHYMSPEQMECTRDVDARTDIWSVGVLLYEMLTGEVPFDGPSITALTVLVVNRAPRPPRELREEIPEGLERVILRCLEKDPDARYPTVADLAEALAPYGSEHTRALATHIERVLEATRARDPLPSLSEIDQKEARSGRPTRPTLPEGKKKKKKRKKKAKKRAAPALDVEERSKTAATWSGAAPAPDAEAQRLKRIALGLAGVAVGAILAVAIAKPWQEEEETVAAPVEPASLAAPEPSAASEPSATPEPESEPSATASASASASTAPAKAPPARPRKKPRRPDIYEGLERDDPYEDITPRKPGGDPYE